jgi:cytochrome P450
MSTVTAEPAGYLPPGPRLPKALGALIFLLWQRPGLKLMRRRYGDAFTIRLPIFGRAVVVSHPDLVKQIFQAKPDVLAFGETSPLGRILGPGSLFSMDGEQHLRERRLILPAFHGERMQSYEGVIEQEALREMTSWPQGSEFPTLEPFMRITLNSILRAVFGAEGDDVKELAEVLPDFVTTGSRLALLPALQKDRGPFSPGRKFQRLRARYDAIIDRMIDKQLADPELEDRADTMSLLLRAHYDDGATMSRTAIADELLTLLAAGHETTATSLAWAVDRLRRHPFVLRRLTQEARDGASKLRLATILEVQRTRPVISGTGRHVLQDFQLGQWRIPKGSHVMVSASLIHNDERFFERPQQFEPDRFVGVKPDTYTWVPFGGGTRRCPGAAFANMEMDIVLRTLLQQFDLQPTTAPDEGWKDRGIAYAPADGGLAKLARCRPAPHPTGVAEPAELVVQAS